MGDLGEITDELVGLLGQKQRSWAQIYRLIARVEDDGLWAPSFRSMTKWMEDLSRRAHCQIQYLWRVKRAGRAYAAFAEREARAGREAPAIEGCGMGDEMIADIDRLSEGNAERTDRYMRAALRGEMSKADVKRIVAATSGRRAAKAGAGKAGRRDEGGGGAAAGDLLASISPSSLYPAELLGRPTLRGERRPWAVLSEFPVRTGSGDRARRIDALCIGPREQREGEPGAWDQYDVTLDMVEIKVTEHDLLGDTKHLEYEPFADRCWFAVPSELEGRAIEAAPDGWGVLSWDPATRRFSRAAEAALRPGPMRHETLATALVKALPQVPQAPQGQK